MKSPRLSVIIPSYNAPDLLRITLQSLLADGISDMEVIVCDDGSAVDTSGVVKEMMDSRVKWYGHSTNIGYGGNLNRALGYATGELIMLLGQDDLVLPGAVQRSIAPFSCEDVNVVTRPYYWFYRDPQKPCRAVYPIRENENTAVTLDSGFDELSSVFWSIAQLSGLVFRRSSISVPFHRDIFTAHAWPFLTAMKTGKCVALDGYTIAVRTESSMTRHISRVYEQSPLEAWKSLFSGVFEGDNWAWARSCGYRYLAGPNTYVGLIQIRSYGGLRRVVRELVAIVHLRPGVLTQWEFVFFALLALLLPGVILKRVTDGYKRVVMGPVVARRLRKAEISYG